MEFILTHNNKLHEKLRKLRYQARPYLTQKQLADKIHTNQTEISRIENGDYPNLVTFINYCYYYGISADELLEMEPINKIIYLE